MQIQTDILKSCLEKVGTVIGKNSIIPVTMDVKIECKSDRIVFSSTDIERSMVIEEEMSNIDTFEVCIPYQIFHDTVKTIQEPIVEITVVENKVTLKAGKGKYSIVGDPIDDFPVFKEIEAKPFQVSTDKMMTAFEKTIPFVSNDQIRIAMTGINLIVNKKTVTMTGTDASALSTVIFSIDDAYKEMVNVIVPKTIYKPFQALFKNEKTVNVSIAENKIQFSTDGKKLSTVFIDAKFPDTSSITVIGDNRFPVVIDRNNLLQSIKRIKIYANNTTYVTSFDIDKEEVSITSEDIDFSKHANEKLVCESSQNLKIGFNIKYIESIISSMDGDKITIFLVNEKSSGIFQETTDDFDHKLVIMPIMVI